MASGDGSVRVLAQPLARVFAVAGTVCIGVLAVAPLAEDRYIRVPPIAWAERIPGPAVAAWLAVGAVTVVAGCFRALAMGVRISHDGVLVRNYFRTFKLSWPEVRRFADGSTPSGGVWALNVVTRSGLAVTATGTATANQARADVVAAIRRAASRHRIAANVRGMPLEWSGPTSRTAPWGLVVWVIFILGFVVAAFAVWPGGHCSGGCWSAS